MPGIPLAEGGPSKKTKSFESFLVDILFSKVLSVFQYSNISLEICTRFKFLYSLKDILTKNANLLNFNRISR